MYIKLTNVNIKFPIYDSSQRSFKKTILNITTGGKILNNTGGKIIEVEALKNINLDIKEGDRVALIGHNGSGKTTLLRVIAGVYTPVSGGINVKGKITSLLDSMLGMDEEATGLENIKLRGLFLGIYPKKIKLLIDDIVEFSELGNFINMPVRTYSSGMILRLAFAISTCIASEIILMDEWISVGDELFKKKAEKRLNEFINKSGILIIATHDYELSKKICTKHIYLEHGVIVDKSI